MNTSVLQTGIQDLILSSNMQVEGYVIQKKLGSGSYCNVYKARNKVTDELVVNFIVGEIY